MSDQPLRVVTIDGLPFTLPRGLEGRVQLEVAHGDAELGRLVRSAEVLFSWLVPDSVPGDTPQLRWIELPSAGADHLRGRPVWNSDVIITSSKGIHAVPMSEHAFGLLLAIVRHIPDVIRAQGEVRWIHDSFEREFRLTELRGKTLGIVGWGKIGQGVAHLARAFGMRVVGTRRSAGAPQELPREGTEAYSDPPWLEPLDLQPDALYPVEKLHDVLAQSDVVLLILPHTAETKNLIGAAEFRSMKPGALFLNIGRGAVVDEEALISALESGQIAGAGLDVFAEEPLPPTSPLWRMPNVIISPHVGGFSVHTLERAAHFFGVNLGRYLEGQPLLNVVDRKQEY